MSTSGAPDTSLDSIFQKKYTEFCSDLSDTYSEKKVQIDAAAALTPEERLRRFRQEVVAQPNFRARLSDEICPGVVLPGVTIEAEHWATFSRNSQKAIHKYVGILGACSMDWSDLSGGMEWMRETMKTWKEKMTSVDFKKLSDKILEFVQSSAAGAAAAAGAGGGGAGMPRLPERFLKGQLAKLAEELVAEFKPEDFGLNVADLEAAGDNPARAFEILMQTYSQRPDVIQNAMKRIAKKLQEKVQRGQLRPQEIAAEAEEMIKEFSENPAFVELMESFRGLFGMEDPDLARAAGREQSARMSLVRERLRKKLEAKKKAGNK
jgi:hypothetical protein